ncbi:MAG: PEP-CTERM sorting domain-containing protein [Phycisphaerales bacterium JB063]
MTDFETGRNGWSVSGRTDVSAVGGNPGANLDVELLDVFGMDIRQESQPIDFTQPFTLTVDVLVDSITFFGGEVTRDFVVEIRDDDNGGANGYASVYYHLGVLDAVNSPGWQTYAVTVDDPTSSVLPMGWLGAGDEDPNTFEPVLPDGRTFADVLAGADSYTFTTFVPGFFFGFTNFDAQVDNVGFTTVPEPGTLGLLVFGGLAMCRRRRGPGFE